MSKQTSQDQNTSSNNDDNVQQYITPHTFKLKNFVVSPILDKYCTKAQYNSFPKYKYSQDAKDEQPLIITTEKIKLTKGGIPKLDEEYRKSDKDRQFFWLGCDNDQPELVSLFDMLRKIDSEYEKLIKNNKETKTIHVLKDKQKEPIDSLYYVPIVRESVIPEDKKNDPAYAPYDRIKVRFSTKYDGDAGEGDLKEINTSLFLLDNEEPEPYTTVTDFTKTFKWNCEARFVLSINKFWAMKTATKKVRDCGFAIKCLQIIITQESTSGGSMSQIEKFKKRMFVPTGPGVKNTETGKPSQTKQKEPKSDDDDENTEDDDDDDSDAVVVTTTKGKSKKVVSKDESEESEESAEEKSESEESESAEESEDDEPKKGQQTGNVNNQTKKGQQKGNGKSQAKKVAAKNDSDSDSDSESDKKKSTKKKVAKK